MTRGSHPDCRATAETRRLSDIGSSTEETFYPAIRDLITAILRAQNLPFEVRTGTSESKQAGAERPDFLLADSGLFGEVKKPDETLEDIAASTEQNDQIGRYLSRTGVALINNVRGFGLLACAPGHAREHGTPVPRDQRDLITTVDLWSGARRPAMSPGSMLTRRPAPTSCWYTAAAPASRSSPRSGPSATASTRWVCKPDWQRHGRAAPGRRNDHLLDLLPRGVIAFSGVITDNLVDKLAFRSDAHARVCERRDAARLPSTRPADASENLAMALYSDAGSMKFTRQRAT